MKKLFFILSLLISTLAFSQARSFEVVTYDASTGRQGYMYKPPGRDSKGPLPGIVMMSGAGERGTNPATLLGSGLASWINDGNDIDAYIIFPQIPTTVSTWQEAQITPAYNYLIANGWINTNMCYPTGLSLGGTGTETTLQANPSRWAAALIVAANSLPRVSLSQTVWQIPRYHVVGSTDSYLSNHYLFIDSANAQNPKPKIAQQMKTVQGVGHSGTVWDGAVYSDFRPWFHWLKLHHKNIDTTAENYMDSLEVSHHQSFYWKTKRLLDFLPASAHKTTLLSRLSAEYDVIYPSGKRAVIDFGVSGYQSSGNVNNITNCAAGQSYTNFILDDGTATTWGLTIVTESASTEERQNGFFNSYAFGLDSVGGYSDARWLWNAGGYDNITGLDPTKRYTFRYAAGISRANNSSQPQSLRITIDGVQKVVSNLTFNTDQFIEFTGVTPNASGVVRADIRSNSSYEAYIAALEIVEEGDAPEAPAVTLTIADQDPPLKQSTSTVFNPVFNTTGNITSYQWTRISGAGDDGQITNPTSDQPGITWTTKPESPYVYSLTVSDGTDSATDTVTFRPRNWQNKNRNPCRVGAPVVHVLTPTYTANGINDFKYPYLTRDGRDIQGGDEIHITGALPANHVYIGDVGGDYGCPVTLKITDAPLRIVDRGPTSGEKGRFHLGKNSNNVGDSNIVNHFVIDGSSLIDSGHKYAIHLLGSSWGITALNVTDLEIKNVLFKGNSLGMQMKMYSDSNYAWSIYDNFTMKNIRIHDCMIDSTSGSEGLYIGHTSPSGLQSGNNGPTNRADSVFIYNNFFRKTKWDPAQISSGRYSEIYNNIVLDASYQDSSSQNWGLLQGGNTTGKIYYNISYNGTSGTIGSLGYGDVEVYNNGVFGTTGSAMYFSQNSTGVLENNPPLKLNVHHNILSGFADRAITHQNSQGSADVGIIELNYFVHPTKTLSELVLSNAGDVVNNNTIETSFPVTMVNLSDSITGPKIEVTQGAAKDTFTTAQDIYDWLYQRISGSAPNVPPVAGAGVDQSITLPASSVTLAGTATDSDGSVVSTTWTFISGPASPSITNASSLTSTVTGLTVAGEYVLRLTVTDDEGGTHTDDMKITVTSPSNITDKIKLQPINRQ